MLARNSGIALLAMVLLVCGAHTLWAKEGASNQDPITIGINVPLSGSYKSQGQDQKRAYDLAIEQLNANGGLLGRRVEAIVRDSQVDPEVAEKNARRFIKKNDVDMITGGSSSSVAIAESDVCQKNGVVFMAAMTHSSTVTGFDKTKTGYKSQKAHKHTFRWYLNNWMTKEALVPFLVDKFGTEVKYFHITADYIGEYTAQEAIQRGTGLHGIQTVENLVTPLGETDFSQELKQAKKSDADILVLNLFGQDLVHAMRQLREMNMVNDFQIVTPLMELNIAHAIDNEMLQKTYSTVNWYQGLADRFSGSRDFVRTYSQEYGRPPGSAAATAWVALKQWAAAVKRAGSTDPKLVIPELEGHSFSLLKEKGTWRKWDHQAVNSVFVVRGKSPQNMANEWDVLKIVKSVPGEEVVRSKMENPVMLEVLK